MLGLLKQHDKSSSRDCTHDVVLYPQNGDRVVAIYYVTLLQPMYSLIYWTDRG